MQNHPDRYIYLAATVAALCAVALVLAMVLHAPLALAVIVWIAWPVVFAVLVVQMVTKHRPQPVRKRLPTVVQHEDGSIEVLR